MQARLHAYVSSHVRQIGAARPCSNRSRSVVSAPTDQLRVEERRQRSDVALVLGWSDERIDRVIGALEFNKTSNERHELGRL